VLEKIFIFIIFLGPLVFFHELGHFLFARFFGVRVLVFSIGFGPKIFKFVKGGTEYAISLIPLGGYVKMFGDDPFSADEIPEEERKYAFTHKGKWARFWIVFGGPLANFIMAFAIFYLLLLSGEKAPEARFGFVSDQSVFYQYGLRTGDRLVKLNKNEILGLTDLSMQASEKEIKTASVLRDKKEVKIDLGMPTEKFLEEFMKIPPRLRASYLLSANNETFAISHMPDKVDWNFSLDQFNSKSVNSSLYLWKVKLEKEMKKEPKIEGKPLVLNLLPYQNLQGFLKQLRTKGYYPLDLEIQSIVMNSPSDLAGLLATDILISLNNESLLGFEDLRQKLQEMPDKKPVVLSYLRKGKTKKVTLTPNVSYQDNKSVKLIGVHGGGHYLQIKYVQSRSVGMIDSISMAFGKTIDSIGTTFLGYKRLFTNEVSLKNVGGPIAIAKVAADSFNISLSYFFKLMALISVNLGVINLFPIPVLDGGHILFIIFEIFNKGPLSRRKMEIAQQFGASLLFLLIFAALFNDISKFF